MQNEGKDNFPVLDRVWGKRVMFAVYQSYKQSIHQYPKSQTYEVLWGTAEIKLNLSNQYDHQKTSGSMVTWTITIVKAVMWPRVSELQQLQSCPSHPQRLVLVSRWDSKKYRLYRVVLGTLGFFLWGEIKICFNFGNDAMFALYRLCSTIFFCSIIGGNKFKKATRAGLKPKTSSPEFNIHQHAEYVLFHMEKRQEAEQNLHGINVINVHWISLFSLQKPPTSSHTIDSALQTTTSFGRWDAVLHFSNGTAD